MKLDELHDRLFDVLCTIDDICRENNLTYYLDGGTELGAVREKGFIPWDDDLDLKILAEDLPLFYEVMKQKLPEHMHIVMPDVFSPYFYDFVIRIYDDRYLLRDETEEDRAYGNYQNRVGTDVFLLQKMPDSKIGQKMVIFKIKALYGKGMAYRFEIDNYGKYSFIQKVQVKILSAMGHMTSVAKILGKYFKLVGKWDGKEAKFRMPSNSPLNYLKVFPAELFDGTDYGEIRGRKFPIPAGYDKELTLLYGDYMTPVRDSNLYVQHLSEEDRWKETEDES